MSIFGGFEYRKASASLCNSLIIIKSLDSLRDDDTTKFFEEYIGTEINTELRKRGAPEITPDVKRIKSVAQLKRELAHIMKSCQKGLRPIIHFETHGHLEKGLEFIDDDEKREIISWECLIEQFRKVNCASEGNLTILAAACHSFRLEDKISLKKKSPFFGLLGYESEATPYQIKCDFKEFYQSAFLKNSFPESSTLSKGCKIYTEYDLAIMLVGVLIAHRVPGFANNLPSSLKKSSIQEDALTLVSTDFPKANLKFLRHMIKDIRKHGSYEEKILRKFIINKENLKILIEDINSYYIQQGLNLEMQA